MASLTGKRAFITGGSRGIGAAIARRLATEGADVVITYERSADQAETLVGEIRATGRRALALRASNADAGQLEGAIDETARALGGIDILINNASVFPSGPLETLSMRVIDETLAVNVRSVVVASRAAAAHLPHGGRIITLGSCLASRVTAPGVSLYALSKSALIGWTKGLARDLGPRGITVNIIHPGPTNTDMNPEHGPHADMQRARMAIPEYGQPEEIAALVAFVAGPEGRFINGAELPIDGGTNT
jgi:3-oxoacyl-[acyl-carrier protein] reductase